MSKKRDTNKSGNLSTTVLADVDLFNEVRRRLDKSIVEVNRTMLLCIGLVSDFLYFALLLFQPVQRSAEISSFFWCMLVYMDFGRDSVVEFAAVVSASPGRTSYQDCSKKADEHEQVFQALMKFSADLGAIDEANQPSFPLKDEFRKKLKGVNGSKISWSLTNKNIMIGVYFITSLISLMQIYLNTSYEIIDSLFFIARIMIFAQTCKLYTVNFSRECGEFFPADLQETVSSVFTVGRSIRYKFLFKSCNVLRGQGKEGAVAHWLTYADDLSPLMKEFVESLFRENGLVILNKMDRKAGGSVFYMGGTTFSLQRKQCLQKSLSGINELLRLMHSINFNKGVSVDCSKIARGEQGFLFNASFESEKYQYFSSVTKLLEGIGATVDTHENVLKVMIPFSGLSIADVTRFSNEIIELLVNTTEDLRVAEQKTATRNEDAKPTSPVRAVSRRKVVPRKAGGNSWWSFIAGSRQPEVPRAEVVKFDYKGRTVAVDLSATDTFQQFKAASGKEYYGYFPAETLEKTGDAGRNFLLAFTNGYRSHGGLSIAYDTNHKQFKLRGSFDPRVWGSNIGEASDGMPVVAFNEYVAKHGDKKLAVRRL